MQNQQIFNLDLAQVALDDQQLSSIKGGNGNPQPPITDPIIYPKGGG